MFWKYDIMLDSMKKQKQVEAIDPIVWVYHKKPDSKWNALSTQIKQWERRVIRKAFSEEVCYRRCWNEFWKKGSECVLLRWFCQWKCLLPSLSPQVRSLIPPCGRRDATLESCPLTCCGVHNLEWTVARLSNLSSLLSSLWQIHLLSIYIDCGQ